MATIQQTQLLHAQNAQLTVRFALLAQVALNVIVYTTLKIEFVLSVAQSDYTKASKILQTMMHVYYAQQVARAA